MIAVEFVVRGFGELPRSLRGARLQRNDVPLSLRDHGPCAEEHTSHPRSLPDGEGLRRSAPPGPWMCTLHLTEASNLFMGTSSQCRRPVLRLSSRIVKKAIRLPPDHRTQPGSGAADDGHGIDLQEPL